METAEKIERSEDRVLKEILKAPVWIYYGDRNQGKPEHSVIALGSDQDTSANAADVLEAMGAIFEMIGVRKGLILELLSQIFVPEPWKHYPVPKDNRKKQPVARNWACLGKCRIQDQEGWIELSVLTGKEIHLVDSDGKVVAVFYPNREYEYFG